MHKSESLFNCSGAGTGEPGAVKAASPGSGRDGQKRSGNRTSLAVYSTIFSQLQGQGMAFRSQRTPIGDAFPEKPLRLRMGSCHIIL